jgi:hypothetical protein
MCVYIHYTRISTPIYAWISYMCSRIQQLVNKSWLLSPSSLSHLYIYTYNYIYTYTVYRWLITMVIHQLPFVG